MNQGISDNILAVIHGGLPESPSDIAMLMASDLRKRRIEKNISRRALSDSSGVPLATLTRFEQKGLISLESLIKLAMALGYTEEIKRLFSQPKYSTMDELLLIRKNAGKKKTFTERHKSDD